MGQVESANRLEQQVDAAAMPKLNGAPLQIPTFHATAYESWSPGQRFSAADDPDRAKEPWKPPRFLTTKDPRLQSQKTVREELTARVCGSAHSGGGRVSFARVIRNVLDPADCAELIRCVNAKGFSPALLNIGRGRQMLSPENRDGHRVIVDSPALASWLFQVLAPHLPAELSEGGDKPTELNERCRFLCYTPGQQFPPHCDGRYARPRGHPRCGEYSYVTVQLYLHDVPVAHGGATTFISQRGRTPCQPVAGSVLLFTQDLLHEGSLLAKGLKYTMRTEVMFKRTPPEDAPVRPEQQREAVALPIHRDRWWEDG